MKPFSSLFAKVIGWFFLNMALVAAGLIAFFAFQSKLDFYSFIGFQEADRLLMVGRLISQDLRQTPLAQWPEVLTRYGEIYRVDFILALENGSHFIGRDTRIPDSVKKMVRELFRFKMPPPPDGPPPPLPGQPRGPEGPPGGASRPVPDLRFEDRKPIGIPERNADKPRLMTRTADPTRYWVGLPVLIFKDPSKPPAPAILLAVSDSITGKGFFFDPLPWLVMTAAVILISVLFWIPLVRNITRPLARMTDAAEEIARGKLEVRLEEVRADEIGRLAAAINHMTTRLCGFVKGQKRFLGDVAHELGSPLARIQFGLGILEQRVEAENRDRVADVMEDVAQLSSLVNELLSFSRAEVNPAKVKLEATELLPLVQRASQREVPPGQEIIIQVDPEARVVADPELLARALANILRNSVKYAGNAGPIIVTAEKRRDEVALEVYDAGPGVPEEFLGQLFEPFFRPEPSRNRDSGGVGLGLAIVKTCIETCQGAVTARNIKPNGFAVTIVLKA